MLKISKIGKLNPSTKAILNSIKEKELSTAKAEAENTAQILNKTDNKNEVDFRDEISRISTPNSNTA